MTPLWFRVFLGNFEALGRAIVNTLRGRVVRGDVSLKPGDAAPDFSLPASDGRTYRMSDSRGRFVVLVWFPRAFTGGCTVQCRSLAVDAAAWGGFDADVWALSVDTAGRMADFSHALGGGAPMLADVSGDVARRYGVLGPGGFPSRWTFYIGPNGRILDIDRSVSPSTHAQDIGSRLAALGAPRRQTP